MNISIIPPAASQDTSQVSGIETAYDTVWAADVPVADPSPLEAVMLADDKLFVVLAVVLVIWFGIVVMLVRTERKIRSLERSLDNAGSENARVSNDSDRT